MPSVKVEFKIPTANNLAELLLSRASYQPAKPALAYKKDGTYQTITWETLAEKVQHLSSFLISHGVQRGSRIALLSENRPEWVIVDLACFTLGASVVPLYPQANEKDIEYILHHSQVCGLFFSNEAQKKKIENVVSALPNLRFCVGFDIGLDSENKVHLDALLKSLHVQESLKDFLIKLPLAASPEDEASVIYTSGTTGPPKGVMLSHRNLILNAAQCGSAIPMGEEDHTLSFLPLSHVFERTCGYYFPLSRGAQVYYAESMQTVPDDIKSVRPTIACSVPRFFEKIYASVQDKMLKASPFTRGLFLSAIEVARKKYLLEKRGKKPPVLILLLARLSHLLVFSKIRRLFGGRLQFFISGGAPLPKEIGEFFYFMGIMILEGYGLTETAPVLAANRLDAFKFGTVGRIVGGVEIKIAEDGEILAKGDNVMKGYFKNPEASQAVLKDNWFYTGDVGSFDAEGYLRITDRKKDIIVTAGGKNISPQNIENQIISDKFITQIIVFGDKKPYLTAIVVPSLDELEDYARFKGIAYEKKDDLLNDKEIRSLITRRISEKIKDYSKHEQIQYIVLRGEEFTLDKGELTPTLKIRRRFITKKYQELVAELYKENGKRVAIKI